MKQSPLSPEALRFTLLHVLKASTASQGMTHGELAERCGASWRRGVAVAEGMAAKAVGAEQVKRYVYELWLEGQIFVEPPGPGRRGVRLWHPDHAARHFGVDGQEASSGAAKKLPDQAQDEVAALRKVYHQLLPQHPSGAVNIYKIRRELGWDDDEFETFLKKLRTQPDSPVEFLGGDPQTFSATQREQSYTYQGTTYFSMLWRNDSR